MENISLGIDIFSMIFITFVLLKTLVFIRPISFKRVGVIIEPYWNWNMGIRALSAARLESYNWTLLELKSTARLYAAENSEGYNWTLLELKFDRVECRNTVFNVIIEPYWNWNYLASYL